MSYNKYQISSLCLVLLASSAFAQHHVVSSLNIKGDDVFSKKLADWREFYHLGQGDVFDEHQLNRFIADYKNAYIYQGYPYVVMTCDHHISGRSVAIDCDLDHGQKQSVASVSFEGNQYFYGFRLSRFIPLKQNGLFSFILGTNPFSPGLVQDSVKKLETMYHQAGFFDVSISVDVSGENDKKVTFSINEGQRYRIHGIVVDDAGLPSGMTESDVLAVFKIHPNDFYDRSDLNQSVRLLNKWFRTKNIDNIEWQAEFLPSSQKILLTPKVFAPFTVDEIHFVDQKGFPLATQSTYLSKVVTLREGQPFSYIKLHQSIRKLSGLSFISAIDYDLEPNDALENYKITFRLKEIDQGNLMLGVGYSSMSEEPQLDASLHKPNLFGTGSDIDFSTSLSKDSQSVNLKLVTPYIGGYDVIQTAALDYHKLDSTDVAENNYNLDQQSASLSYSIYVNDDWRSSVGVSWSNNDLTLGSVTGADPRSNDYTRLGGPNFQELMLNVGVQYADVDMAYAPKEGIQFSANLSRSLDVNDATIDLWKVSAQAHYYNTFAIMDQFVTFHSFTQMGYGELSGGNLDFLHSYKVGGPSSLRGFNMGTADDFSGTLARGGQYMWIERMNLLAPLSSMDGRMQVFFDAGLATNDAGRLTDGDWIRQSVGAEVEIISPIGPLTFGVAEVLSERSDDNTKKTYFRFGGLL